MSASSPARSVPTIVLAGVLFANPSPAGATPQAAAPADPARRVVNDRCPVMTDEFASPLQEVEYRGATVRFCCPECVERFEADPAPFLANIPHLPPEPARLATAETRNRDVTQVALLGMAGLLACWVGMRRLWHRRAAGHLSPGGPPGEQPSREPRG